MRRLVAALACAVCAALPLRAQTVAGTVRDSASGQPIPGAVIQLLGAGGEARGRALSDARGAFSVRASGAVSSVRVVRIGFRPAITALGQAAGDTPRLTIDMVRIPAFLDPVRVVAAQCRRGRSRGRSPIGLIEQARAGLLTSIVTRDENPAAMTRLTYERSFDDDPRRPSRQLVRLDSSTQQTRSFRAAQDADAFVRNGFSLTDGGEQYFFAPDAEVLLDDRFAAGYCFRVMPRNRQRPREIGLGFEPATRQAGRVDVEGALWIDTVARELRDLEFRYIGLDRRVEALEPGGSIAFVTLPNGMVIVDRWEMRLIGAAPDTLMSTRPGTLRITSRFIELRNGGELASATWRDGTQWQARLGSVRGTARWQNGGVAPAVTLGLRGTPFRTTTDRAGQYAFTGLLPGSYQVIVLDDALQGIGLTQATSAWLTSARDSVTVPLTIPARAEVAIQHCRASGPFDPAGDTYVLGRALRADGSPIEGARWDVRISDGGAWMELAAGARTGSDGLMSLCFGIRRGYEVEIVVRTPDGLTDVQRRRLVDEATVIPFVFPAVP